MLYDISLKTEYEYKHSAHSSRHMVRLMPADLPGEQRLVAGSLDFSQVPDEREDIVDFFTNRAVGLTFLQRHDCLRFTAHARVERLAGQTRLDTSTKLSVVGGEIGQQRSLGPNSPHHFTGPSVHVPRDAETRSFAASVAKPSMSVLECVTAVGTALHHELSYDAKATTVDTPMTEAFRKRRGVCQDFTHIMIACLRGIGIPAGYVSGFLRTIPQPGMPRLEGADSMHAWVRAWCGADFGWVEYDPTNAVFAGTDHIVAARGRDYFDVTPVKGIMRSHGEHQTKQSVDVVPVGKIT